MLLKQNRIKSFFFLPKYIPYTFLKCNGAAKPHDKYKGDCSNDYL